MELKKNKQSFIVIEKDPSIVDKIIEDGFLYLTGDATEDEVLLKAGIKNAKSIISTLPDDSQNVFVVLTARKLCYKIDITSRAASQIRECCSRNRCDQRRRSRRPRNGSGRSHPDKHGKRILRCSQKTGGRIGCF